MQAPIYSILGSCQPTSRVHHRRRSVFRDPVVHSNSRISGNLNIWAPTKGSSATCLLADVYKDFMVISMFDSQGVVFFFFCVAISLKFLWWNFVWIQTLDAPELAKPEADPKTVASIILGGGAGTRLFPLTKSRAKPAVSWGFRSLFMANNIEVYEVVHGFQVPIGGCYRLIDVPMSNCINSGINKIYILTQFNSQSLNRHIARTYNLGSGVNFGDGFVEVCWIPSFCCLSMEESLACLGSNGAL